MNRLGKFIATSAALASLSEDAFASDFGGLAVLVRVFYLLCSFLFFLIVWWLTNHLKANQSRALIRIGIACLLWTPIQNEYGTWWPAPLFILFDPVHSPIALAFVAIAAIGAYALMQAFNEYRGRRMKHLPAPPDGQRDGGA